VDTKTRHALKQDKFAQATASSFGWLGEHSASVLRWGISAVVVVVLVVGGLVFWNMRTAAADRALGAALDTYNAPLAEPGVPAVAGEYASARDRSRAAHDQFATVAEQYGWLADGTKAHYFSGITDQELGNTASAEQELEIAAGSHNRDLANLAKLALAGVYRETAQNDQAVSLYNELVAKPSETVSAVSAQLDLADLYASEGKQDQARALWAKVQDADKEGAAGSIAAQKLGAKQ
jgi:predicted negative regulator of RcsB-dependent stress response